MVSGRCSGVDDGRGLCGFAIPVSDSLQSGSETMTIEGKKTMAKSFTVGGYEVKDVKRGMKKGARGPVQAKKSEPGGHRRLAKLRASAALVFEIQEIDEKSGGQDERAQRWRHARRELDAERIRVGECFLE